MAVGISNFQTLYQTFFPERDLSYLAPSNLPFIHLIQKEDGLSGDLTDHPFLYGTPQGYSQDFATAMAQSGAAPRAARAAIRTSQAYAALEVLDKDEALSHGQAAYSSLWEEYMTGKMAMFWNNLDLDLHGTGTGWRGTVIATAGQQNPYAANGITVPANSVVLQTAFPIEAVFELDQLLVANTYAGFPLASSIFPPSDGRVPTSTSPSVQITAIDPLPRVITLTDASQFAIGSFVCMAGGSMGFSASNLLGSLIGMECWNPFGGVASNDNFCGLNRSPYKTRMAGYSYDGSRLSIEDAFKRLGALMSMGGATNSNVGLIHPLDYDALDSKFNSSVQRSQVQTPVYGFDSIVINTAAGRLDLIPDPHQPQGWGRIIDPSTWKLRHCKAVPHVVDVNGVEQFQALNFDGRTARLRFYGQLFCMDPRKNGTVKLPQVLI